MRKKIKALLKNQKGFTLVELLAVIVILGIIAAIAVPSIANIIDNSKKDAHVANAQELVNAARLSIAANEKTLRSVGAAGFTATDSNDGTAKITMKELVAAGYLEADIKDPDSNGNYSVAYVTYDETTKKYKVFLDGSERNVEDLTTAGAAADAATLKRDNVK